MFKFVFDFAKFFVLGLFALTVFGFEVNVGDIDVQRFCRRFAHQFLPSCVLTNAAIVRSLEFDNVQVVFVDVDNEGEFRNVTFVKSITSDSFFGPPT